jgi:hypothetical protein
MISLCTVQMSIPFPTLRFWFIGGWLPSLCVWGTSEFSSVTQTLCCSVNIWLVYYSHWWQICLSSQVLFRVRVLMVSPGKVSPFLEDCFIYVSSVLRSLLSFTNLVWSLSELFWLAWKWWVLRTSCIWTSKWQPHILSYQDIFYFSVFIKVPKHNSFRETDPLPKKKKKESWLCNFWFASYLYCL